MLKFQQANGWPSEMIANHNSILLMKLSLKQFVLIKSSIWKVKQYEGLSAVSCVFCFGSGVYKWGPYHLMLLFPSFQPQTLWNSVGSLQLKIQQPWGSGKDKWTQRRGLGLGNTRVPRVPFSAICIWAQLQAGLFHGGKSWVKKSSVRDCHILLHAFRRAKPRPEETNAIPGLGGFAIGLKTFYTIKSVLWRLISLRAKSF